MRKAILILLSCITLSLNATTYYVATTGSDAAAGSLAAPWATWQKAFNTAVAGDTVYFRGGVYTPTSKVAGGYPITLIAPSGGYGHSGTHDNPIVYEAYPPDFAAGNYPILDCSVASGTTTGNIGIDIEGAQYIKFKGLTVQNVKIYRTNGQHNMTGVAVADCLGGYMSFENMDIHHIGGAGFEARRNDTVYVINSDSHNNCDSTAYYLWDTDEDPETPMDTVWDEGGDGDGFLGSTGGTDVDSHRIVVFTGCRSWYNSDDGFDIGSTKQIQVDNCWTWANGTGYYDPPYDGDGGGFKLSYSSILEDGKRWIKNCITAYNETYGYIDTNGSDEYGYRMYYHNNTSYKDWLPFASANYGNDCGLDSSHCVYRNNIAYAYTGAVAGNFTACGYVDPYPVYITESNNTWTLATANNTVTNTDYTVTDGDFISLDTAQLRYPRQSDWSLPNIDFMKLSPTSDLVDGGYDVGLDYFGTAPDLGWAEYSPGPQIIADHTIVDDYDSIPQYYIDEVKKMWLSYAGESHSEGIRYGLLALETADTTYSVSVVESGTPEAYTDANLRASRATWGDVTHSTGWIYDYGEQDWFVTELARTRTKASLDYCNTTGPELAAFGFGWCWDDNYYAADSINKYISATQEYIDHAEGNSMLTKVFFTTGPVDSYTLGVGWLKSIAYDQIRDSVLADTTRIFFDYADILCYDDGATEPNTRTYDGHVYPWITDTNLGDAGLGHIGPVGRLRLAKAMWWMLARMAGWDGNITVYSEVEIDSTLTDILTFTLPTQTGAATINATNHTVAIEVNYLATVTNLTPSITVSYGATISPTSMTSRDFTTPQTYTVTALDGTTTQEWVVTVTQAEEPAAPAGDSSIVKYRGLIFKL
jgi:hypothetical protein